MNSSSESEEESSDEEEQEVVFYTALKGWTQNDDVVVERSSYSFVNSPGEGGSSSSTSSPSRCNNIWKEEGGVNLLDTGTQSLLSTDVQDFLWDEGRLGKVSVHGVKKDCPATAWRMKLRKNCWGFSEGLWIKELPKGIKRLVPVPPNFVLQEYRTGVSGFLQSTTNPRHKFQVTPTVPPTIAFYRVKEDLITCREVTLLARPSKLLVHKRLAHITRLGRHGTKCRCLSCLKAKSIRRTRKQVRRKIYKPKRSLAQLDHDFIGRIRPDSVRGCKFVLIVICPKSFWIRCIPLQHKSQLVGELRKLIQELEVRYGQTMGERLVFYIRADNEAVNVSREIGEFLASRRIQPLRPPPYNPSLNPVVERGVRVVSTYLRSTMEHIDARLWCYGVTHVGDVHCDVYTGKGRSSTPHETLQLDLIDEKDPRWREKFSPCSTEEERDRRNSSLPYRTFGCLAIAYNSTPSTERSLLLGNEVEEEVGPMPKFKFSPKWVPAVYLGHDRASSNAVIGMMKHGKMFERRERHVRLVEDVGGWSSCVWSPDGVVVWPL